MTRLFPETFDYTLLKGPRGKTFSRSEDAFQQLIGDGLREQFGPEVFVSPTLGPDGGIDVLLETEHAMVLPPFSLPSPWIVECKDHSRSTRQRDNLFKEFSRTTEKLYNQAKAGWPDLFKPWRCCRGYAYCISATLAPAIVAELEAELLKFFAALPEAVRPPLCACRVISWNQIRPWLDEMPSLRDRWLGVGLPKLVGHAEFMSTLIGSRRYLVEYNLPFIAPPEKTIWHPQQLFRYTTQQANVRGVVLMGRGGVGKTRTLLEVAQVASLEGWRVLHALTGEPGLRETELIENLLQGKQKTLLLIDYLEQLQLDFDIVRRELLPLTVARGIPFAILASARPVHSLQPKAGLGEFFVRIDMLPEQAFSSIVTQHIIRTVAPQSIAKLGLSLVQRLCGTRPIIGLLIALELEQRARRGDLDVFALAELRSGDLASWLRRRLREDELLISKSASVWDPSEPGVMLEAIAAVLAASPQSEPVLERVASVILKHRPASNKASTPSRVLGLLRRFGWLEERLDGLVATHDVVVDEILEHVLWDQQSGSLRNETLRRLLEPCIKSSAVLGNYAISLRRLFYSSTEKDRKQFLVSLQKDSEAWLVEHVFDLAWAIRNVELRQSPAFTLSSLASGPPWREGLAANWQNIAQLWLDRYQAAQMDRVLMRKIVASSEEAGDSLFIEIAINWSVQNYKRRDSRLVMIRLLWRTDLSAEQSERIQAAALGWLRSYRSDTAASSLILPLVRRHGSERFASPKLTDGDLQLVLDCAATWSRGAGATSGMYSEVLQALESLEGVVLPVEFQVSARGSRPALGNVKKMPEWVRSLIGQTTLRSEMARSPRDIERLTSWLCSRETIGTAEWSYALEIFLHHPVPLEAQRRLVVETAFEWVSQPGAKEIIFWSFVVQALLAFGRPELSDAGHEALLAIGLDWLCDRQNFQSKAWRHMGRWFLIRGELQELDKKRLLNVILWWLSEDGLEQQDHWSDIFVVLAAWTELHEHLADFVKVFARWLSAPEQLSNVRARALEALPSLEMMNRTAFDVIADYLGSSP